MGFNSGQDLAAVLTDIANQRFRQASSAAVARLREVQPAQKCGDGMAKAPEPKIDFAEAIEEQESGTYDVVLELACHELEGRER